MVQIAAIIYISIIDGKNNTYVSTPKRVGLMGDECINVGLDNGEYYVRVNPNNTSAHVGVEYKLKTSFFATDFYEKEFNNSYSNANEIKLNQAYGGEINPRDEYDYFKFTLSKESKVSLQVDVNGSDSDRLVFAILDGKGKNYLSYVTGGKGIQNVDSLSAGDFYVRVHRGFGNNTDYSFSVLTDYNQVERISGNNRYNTAIEISKAGWDKTDTVLLTRGDNFADALAGVPLAYQLDAPILMTPTNNLRAETWQEIKRLGVKKAIILGGTGAVSDSVKKTLETNGIKVERISGSNRTETAVQITKKMFPKGTNKAVVANGMDFPDALSVAAYAAKDGMPILLTQSNKLSRATEQVIKDLGVKQTIVVGGNGVVSEPVKNKLPSATRLGGKDRYETNIALAKHFGVDNKHIYAVTGTGFADALTGAVLAAKDDSAIGLVHHRVPDAVDKYIKEKKPNKVSIFGGAGAVSDSVADSLEDLLK